jgi:hypothetical protein
MLWVILLRMNETKKSACSASRREISSSGVVGDHHVAPKLVEMSSLSVRWLAWAKTQGTAPVELYMPPLKYHFAGENGLTNGLYNVTISGYGATVDSLFIGTKGLLHDDFDHSGVQTVFAGATSVNLMTPADGPVVDHDLVENLGGPASIFALGPTFDAEQRIFGLEVTADSNDGAVFMSAVKFDGAGPV